MSFRLVPKSDALCSPRFLLLGLLLLCLGSNFSLYGQWRIHAYMCMACQWIVTAFSHHAAVWSRDVCLYTKAK